MKLTKRCLRKTLGHAKLTFEEFETALIETEAILNSRPLTYVSEELTEPPLTPSYLVCGRRLLENYSVFQEVVQSDKKTLSAHARYVETLIEHFRNRWRKEYLPALREHHKNVDKTVKRSVQVGDIVHIHKDKTPRQRWSMGKVTLLLPGKDGICRAVKVLCLDKAGKSVELKRPIQRLYPLEVRAEQHKTELDPVVEDNSNIEVTIVRDEDIP